MELFRCSCTADSEVTRKRCVLYSFSARWPSEGGGCRPLGQLPVHSLSSATDSRFAEPSAPLPVDSKTTDVSVLNDRGRIPRQNRVGTLAPVRMKCNVNRAVQLPAFVAPSAWPSRPL